MAGLVSAIHVFAASTKVTRPGMTTLSRVSFNYLVSE
jgi:hypothetical protein